MRWLLLLLAAIWLPGCGDAPSSTHSPTPAPASILGTWKLREVGGGDPRRLNIDTFQIDFKVDGKLAFEAMMTGQYAGMSLKGHGTWKVDGSTMTWTVGANSGTSTVSLGSGTLRLHPDPVLAQPGGKGPIDSAYHR